MQTTEVNPQIHQEHQQALIHILREFDRVCKALHIPYILFAGTLLGAVRHQGFIPWDDDLDVIMDREDYDRFLREADGVLDREKFFLQKEFSEHWPMFFSKLRMNGTTCLEKYHPRDSAVHQGIYMDIFPCDRAAESGIGRKIQFFCSKVVIAKSLYVRGYETDSKAKKLFMQLCRLLPMGPFLRAVKGGKPDSRYVHSFLGASSSFSKSVYPREIFADITQGNFCEGSFPIPARYDALLTILYGDYMTLPPPEARKCKQHAILVDLNKSYEEYAHYRDGMQFDIPTRSIR